MNRLQLAADAAFQIAFGVAWLPLFALNVVHDLWVFEHPERRRMAKL